MTTFVDTSALLAVMDADDLQNPACAEAWAQLLASPERLVTHSYVLVEVFTLVQRRFGLSAVRFMDHEVSPALEVVWIEAADHRAGMSALLEARRRKVSLVDCVSFAVMRRLAIDRAFAVDRHFRQAGFETLPG